MTSTQELLNKADLTIADLEANGGALQPEEGARFIRKLIKQPTTINDARVVEMRAPKRNINKIGFTSRILRKATSATALSEADRAKPVTEQIQLDTKEQIAEVRLPYDVLEDNVERATAANNEPSNTGPGGLRQTLIDLIAERSSTDLEELAITADTGSGDTFLAQLDGWLKIGETDGNVADVAGAAISKAVFKQGIKTMPDQFLRNRGAMRHYVSQDQETEYRDSLASRGTGLGDSMTTGLSDAFAFGTPVRAASLMPNTKGIFTNPNNLIFGIQRDVSMEFDKDISARVYIIVLTLRIDFKVEEPDAMVVYNNIAQ